MKSDMSKKYEKRLRAIANANKSEYQRLVEDNKELQAELVAIRGKYGLPSANDEHAYQKYHQWLDAARITPTEAALDADIDEIAKKHGVAKWRKEIKNLATYGRAFAVFSMGLPGTQYIHNADGTTTYKPDIPPDFDATNPIAVEALTRIQAQNQDVPPSPQPMKDDPTKTDWRPVWEWHHRHPEVPDKEIAQMLGVNRVTVTRHFNELDAEYNAPTTK